MIADPTKIEPLPGFGEPVAAMSHLAAAAIFAALTWPLLRRGRGSGVRVGSLGVYAFACVFQMAMSGVYHMLRPGSVGNQVLLRLDHAAIFFLIAATFTPIHVILFRGFWRWGKLAFIWSAAITGIVLKTVFSASTPLWLGALLYLGLGWMGIVTGVFLWRRHGFRVMAPLLYGGIAFSAGLALEVVMATNGVLQIAPGVFGGHELFHFAVLAGMAIHWKFIYGFANGQIPPLIERKQQRSEPAT